MSNYTDHNATQLSKAEDSFQHNAAMAKSSYEIDLITIFANTSNPAVYRHIRTFTKSATILPADAASASSNISRANLFNQYFHSVITQSNVVSDHANFLVE